MREFMAVHDVFAEVIGARLLEQETTLVVRIEAHRVLEAGLLRQRQPVVATQHAEVLVVEVDRGRTSRGRRSSAARSPCCRAQVRRRPGFVIELPIDRPGAIAADEYSVQGQQRVLFQRDRQVGTQGVGNGPRIDFGIIDLDIEVQRRLDHATDQKLIAKKSVVIERVVDELVCWPSHPTGRAERLPKYRACPKSSPNSMKSR